MSDETDGGDEPSKQRLRLEFRGKASEYFRIWIVNLFLTLATLGIFSAWAKVRKKRYFYSHTLLDGTSFEYRGRPIPILKGRIIAVAALNPHGGEDGAFGDEEADIIAPAVAELREAGIDAFGPVPADTLFHAAARQRYDAVLCMYHDQALIPLKTLAFDSGANVTLGLPFVRTSPDHGTAFDIAGKGVADAGSMRAALELAVQLATARREATV